jgi:small subunit ribosomal protein S17
MRNARRKNREGVVVSNKSTKTIVVKVEKVFRHPLYKKIVRAYKKYMAHDEKGEAKIGDFVLISETRPISKRKCWRLMKILKKAEQE